MSKPTYLSYFAGGDLAGCGLRAAGYVPDTLVELDPAIAEVARANHPDARVLVADVTTVDPRRFERPDLFWASPECKEFSQGKTKGQEGPIQIAQAEAICLALRTLRPPTFCLENVVRYRHSSSLGRIRATLADLGYLDDLAVLNAADFGVPQTRRRLILRACLGQLVPHLPGPVPWQGWYGAIEDLAPTLPDSQFADWQLARLDRLTNHSLFRGGNPNANGRLDLPGTAPATTVIAGADRFVTRAFLVGGGNTQLAKVDSWPREGGQPAFTVAAGDGSAANMRALLVSAQSANGGPPSLADGGDPAFAVGTNSDRVRAVLISGQNAGQEWGWGYKADDEPAMTVAAAFGARPAHMPRAFIVHPTDQRSMPVRDEADPIWTLTAGSNATRNPDMRPRAWIDEGRVVKMTPRALARFQSVPDTFRLPDKAGLATQVIGNGVPCLLAQRIGEAFLRGS